jgi:hypothetical protein
MVRMVCTPQVPREQLRCKEIRDQGASMTAAGRPVRSAALSRLRMTIGLFALMWTVIVVLMILRPGSTTGVGR